jgi:hypothetical protein
MRLFSFVLFFIGISGMVFAIAFDFFKGTVPNFGINQLAGFVISAIIALAGLRNLKLLRARIWDGILLLVYLAGILFMGLRSTRHGHNRSSGMLESFSFSFFDVAINIVGFIPLSYLMVSYLLPNNRIQKKMSIICLTLVSCIGISLLIEILQHYIPGRSSSRSDLLFNGLGSLGGIIYYLLEKRLTKVSIDIS